MVLIALLKMSNWIVPETPRRHAAALGHPSVQGARPPYSAARETRHDSRRSQGQKHLDRRDAAPSFQQSHEAATTQASVIRSCLMENKVIHSLFLFSHKISVIF